jgi:hypothetical protein
MALALDIASIEKGFTQSESKELRALKEYFEKDYDAKELIRLANKVTKKDELCEAMWRRGDVETDIFIQTRTQRLRRIMQ